MIFRAPHVTAGPYVVGEKPAPWTYTFKDANGAAINIAGYTVKLIYKERDGLPTTVNANLIDGVNGIVGYTILGTEFPYPGAWQAEFWAGNGTQRFCSWLIVFDVRASVGVAPAI
jgi:hypothetical protein